MPQQGEEKKGEEKEEDLIRACYARIIRSVIPKTLSQGPATPRSNMSR